MKKVFNLILPIALAISGLAIFTNAKADLVISHMIDQDNKYTINLMDNDDNNIIIGSISYEQTQPLCWKINEVFVATKQRNMGYGKILITQCIQHISAFGFEKIEFDVMPIDPEGPSLEQLISFYTKIFRNLAPAPFYTLQMISDEECPWLATVKMVITKKSTDNLKEVI